MGRRKKHHYIPRFYLKRFSVNNEGKTVGLYNHVNKVFIQSAPIRHQACKEYLYGTDDEIEAELAKLESSIAQLFHYWTEEKILVPPPEHTPAFKVLKRFILYQLFRIPKAGDDINEAVTQAFHAIVRVYQPEKVEEIKGSRVEHPEPVLLAFVHAADKEHLLNYLACKFIVNLSELPFITSDAPVVRYNQLLEGMGLTTGADALTAKGLQIFYPIHPRLMICFYDPKVYVFTENKDCIGTESIDDVHQLNALQYLNSQTQLFFDDIIAEEYIAYVVEQHHQQRGWNGPMSQLTITSDNRYFLFSSNECLKTRLDLSFLKIADGAKDFPRELSPLRHPSLERGNENPSL